MLMKIVTVEQMQAIERSADAGGLSYDTMMHNAGSGIADWVYQHIYDWQSVIGLVGSGNNGGDTIIALNNPGTTRPTNDCVPGQRSGR
jgi:ADP-dependent NAD(P)H-hydrate dehydratase / NAD(P)H-hydrate epimerase